MTTETEAQKLQKAQGAIALILRDLELSTGKRVEWLGMSSFDITRINDPCKRMMTHVVITLEEPYLREWS